MSLPRICTHRASAILSRRTLVSSASVSGRRVPSVFLLSVSPASRLFSSSNLHLSRTVTAAPTGAQTSQSQKGDSHSDESRDETKERVLYERRPDWYIRLIPLLIVLDLAMFVNFSELIVNHWTEPVLPSTDSTDSTSPPASQEQTLKPAWKRWGTAGASMALASAVAGLLLVVRGRVIRRIVQLPALHADAGVAGAVGPKILIETAGNSSWNMIGGGTGRVVPTSVCEWGQGRDTAELFVSLPKVRGRFGLTFKAPATILGQGGKGSDPEQNRRRFEEAWRGTRSGGGRWAPLVPPPKKADSYYS